MKKSAFIRSQLEASKIGQKVPKKIFLKMPFSTSIFEVLSNLYCLSLVQNMLAEGEKKGKGKRREKKRKGKMRKKWGSKFLFYKSVRMF